MSNYIIEAVKGVVKNLESINGLLTFVTINPINPNIDEMKVPVYMDLGQEYNGKLVDIITERKGHWKGNIRQTIESESAGLHKERVLSCSTARELMNNYNHKKRK